VTPDLEILTEADSEAAASVLGRAFRDNPMNLAVIGDDAARRERCNQAGVRAYIPAALVAGPVWGAWRERRLCGVLVSMPPGGYPLPIPSLRDWWRLLRVQGPRLVRRWGNVAAELADLHPSEPHWTLATLGVDPVDWRSGVGSELLSALTEHVSESPAPIYLDTDRPENLAFYARAGFEEIGRVEIQGVTVHRMLRPAP
jgi:ribosomal protein S18 acetylase RimI-like enzyme